MSTAITITRPNDMQHAPIPMADAEQSQAQRSLRFRVIVPAHNEEAVIGRFLQAVLRDCDPQSDVDIIVVANGCTDHTATIARSFGHPVRVIETSIASKANAINLGLEGLGNQPCLIADADIVCPYDALRATAKTLTERGVFAASPRSIIDFSNASGWVRAYYKVWSALPYARKRLIGGGVYGISPEGAARLGLLPDVIADDLYVRSSFAFGERRTVRSDDHGNEVAITMYPPRNVRDLIFIEARRWRGSRELQKTLGPGQQIAKNGLGSLVSELGKSFSFFELAGYSSVKLASRALALFQLVTGHQSWSRDLSSRVAP